MPSVMHSKVNLKNSKLQKSFTINKESAIQTCEAKAKIVNHFKRRSSIKEINSIKLAEITLAELNSYI